LREVLKIQIFRSHFNKKCEQGRRTQQTATKTFAACNAPCDSKNFEQNGKQKLLLFSPAARVGFS
jgi:hypothetical protein